MKKYLLSLLCVSGAILAMEVPTPTPMAGPVAAGKSVLEVQAYGALGLALNASPSQILGVAADASVSTIGKRFRELARTWHPTAYSRHPMPGISTEVAREVWNLITNAKDQLL